MKNKNNLVYPFSLPQLKFSYEELMPFLDAKTVDVHYNKHHASYVEKLNEALKDFPELHTKNLREILNDLENIPESIRETVKNQGGGHINHSLYWSLLKPGPMSEPSGELAFALKSDFHSFENFRKEFGAAIEAVFASGWVVLIKDYLNHGKLKIRTFKNHDSIFNSGVVENSSSEVVLICDVWEHAYYLNYQNRRSDYVSAFWNIIDWHEVEERFKGTASIG